MEFSLTPSDFEHETKNKIRDIYKLGKKIGDGKNSIVRSLTHRVTKEKRAVKIISKRVHRSEEEKKMFFNEVSILSQLDHPNIIQLFEFFQDEKSYYIITELCEEGDLFEKILSGGCFSEAEAAAYIRRILSVILYMHERGIAHRDLRPDNFLFKGSHLKAIDFVSAAHFEAGSLLTDKVGSPHYIAPEVLTEGYNEKCDIWSAGVILFILLCGIPPFHGNSDREIINSVRIGHFVFLSPESDHLSEDAKNLVKRMLTYNFADRPSARECLNCEWLRTPLDSVLPQTAYKYMWNLSNFKSQAILQKVALWFIGSQLSTNEDREDMVQLFNSLDTDMNGTLNREELKIGIERILGSDFLNSEEELDIILAEVDVDLSGSISYSEFVTAAIDREKILMKDKLEMAFDNLDIDGSGAITLEELKNMLGNHYKMDDLFWEQLIFESDQNNDGEIQLEEFMHMMNQFISSFNR